MNQDDKPTAGSIEDPNDLEKASLDTVYEKLLTSPAGLTSIEAKARIEKYGCNLLIFNEVSDLEKFLRFFGAGRRLAGQPPGCPEATSRV